MDQLLAQQQNRSIRRCARRRSRRRSGSPRPTSRTSRSGTRRSRMARQHEVELRGFGTWYLYTPWAMQHLGALAGLAVRARSRPRAGRSSPLSDERRRPLIYVGTAPGRAGHAARRDLVRRVLPALPRTGEPGAGAARGAARTPETIQAIREGVPPERPVPRRSTARWAARRRRSSTSAVRSARTSRCSTRSASGSARRSSWAVFAFLITIAGRHPARGPRCDPASGRSLDRAIVGVERRRRQRPRVRDAGSCCSTSSPSSSAGSRCSARARASSAASTTSRCLRSRWH